MSGVSEDGKNLWQIGIDVLPDYRGHGLATYLTETMKKKVLSLGHVPYYGTSESHSLSMDTAIRSGFLPAWAEVYTRKITPTPSTKSPKPRRLACEGLLWGKPQRYPPSARRADRNA